MNFNNIHYPNKLDNIFDKLDKNGIKIVIVGGFVRDSILHKNSKDIDIELYNLNSFSQLEILLREFGDINSVGKSFGVCKLQYEELDLDFSLPRKDSKHSAGHKGFDVIIDSSLDFKTAASRRDFTINSIGYDVKEKKILDPFNGMDDLKNSLLRAVDLEKFIEDPLRILRAIQFSARFKFRLDEALFSLCFKMIQENILDELPSERIYTELQKLLLKSKKPSMGLLLAKELGLSEYFGEYLSFEEIDYFALHKTDNDKNNILIFLALLYTKHSLYQISKITSEVKLIRNVEIFLETREVFPLENFNEYDVYKLATVVNIELFISYLNATYLGSKAVQIRTLQNKASKLGVLNAKMPALIQGRNIIALGIKPSKEFKMILDEAYQAQMRGEFASQEEADIWIKSIVKTPRINF